MAKMVVPYCSVVHTELYWGPYYTGEITASVKESIGY